MRSISFLPLGTVVVTWATERRAAPLGDLAGVREIEVSRRGQPGYATVVSPPPQAFPDSAVRSLPLPPEDEADI
ncbi:MAG TPA: hypothetical protein VFU01_00150 [Gemmatimonadaceae bacterium]|nr:hypothetical protein [Gemmatimonadaceae bacterium]